MAQYGNARLVRVLMYEPARTSSGRSSEQSRWGAIDPEQVIMARALTTETGQYRVELTLATGQTVVVGGRLGTWSTEYAEG